MLEDAKISWFLASRAIRRGNKGTTIMTIVILAVVFINMLFLPSVLAGFLQNMNNQDIDYNGHMVIHPRTDDRFIEDATEVSQKIGGIPGVIGVTQRLADPVIITYKDRVVSLGVNGIDPLNEKTVTKLDTGIVRGEFLDESDTDSIVIGKWLAGDKNKIEEDEQFYSLRGVNVGDSLTLTFNNGFKKDYRVKGILSTDYDAIDYNAYINLRELAEVTGSTDEASSINIRLSPSISTDNFKLTLMKYGIQQRIRTWNENAVVLQEELGGTFVILGSVSTIAGLFISIIIMFVVVYINTNNKRKQIGIIKAIGVDRNIIANSYAFQVIIFAICGILAGLILFLSIVFLMTINPISTPEGPLIPFLDIGAIIQAAASLFIASIIAGYIPAWNTAKLDILDAMKG